METGDTEAALQAAATAIERNPTSAVAYEMKGNVHALRREIRLAAGAFGEAYRLEPSVGRLAKRAETLLLVDSPNHSEVIELLVSSPPDPPKGASGKRMHGSEPQLRNHC